LDFSQHHLDFIEKRVRRLLKSDSQTTVSFMDYFLNFVFHHPGEISTYKLVKRILNAFGIPAGNDKLAALMKLLVTEEWLYVKTREQWHVGRKGRARSYGLGKHTIGLFKQGEAPESSTNNNILLNRIYLLSPEIINNEQ
jgi:hypothetical protein